MAKVEVQVVPKRSAAELDETKELRSLLKALGDAAGISKDTPNRRILDVDYKTKEVYFGTEVVGEFASSGSSEAPQFVIHEDRINSEAHRLGYKFAADLVKKTYDDFLLEITL